MPFAKWLARFVSTSLREFLRRLGLGSVKACHLTRHAVDGGDAPRYFGSFLAVGVVRFDGESALRPTIH